MGYPFEHFYYIVDEEVDTIYTVQELIELFHRGSISEEFSLKLFKKIEKHFKELESLIIIMSDKMYGEDDIPF